jgi:hypothetical protein
MGAMSLALQCAISDDTDTDDCLLVAPPEAVAVAHTLGIAFTDVAADLPTSPPVSGLFVCLPRSQVHELPPGWTGVWGRSEPLPQESWVPLPVEAVTDPHALGRALQAADFWRRQWHRLQAKTLPIASGSAT